MIIIENCNIRIMYSAQNIFHNLFQILSGPDMNRVAIYCNTSHPRPLTVSGNQAIVHFHTNEAVNDAGFQLSYASVEGNFFLKFHQKGSIIELFTLCRISQSSCRAWSYNILNLGLILHSAKLNVINIFQNFRYILL